MFEEIRRHQELQKANILRGFGINSDEELEFAKGELEYDELQKAVYADTAENRKLGRVGQEYHRGKGKKEGEMSNDSSFKELKSKYEEAKRQCSSAREKWSEAQHKYGKGSTEAEAARRTYIKADEVRGRLMMSVNEAEEKSKKSKNQEFDSEFEDYAHDNDLVNLATNMYPWFDKLRQDDFKNEHDASEAYYDTDEGQKDITAVKNAVKKYGKEKIKKYVIKVFKDEFGTKGGKNSATTLLRRAGIK